MPTILGWYLFGQLVSWCALPLTWSVFRKLEDRGYAARHAVGLLVTGFLLWAGTAARLVTNDRQGAFVALGATLLLGVLAGRRGLDAGGESQWRQLREWCSRRWRFIAVHEAVFLLAFLGWCWVRQHDSAINHTEQPMDLMLLAGILADRSFPIQDPWLSGYAVSYYYLGYWLQATLAHLAGSLPEVAYHLAQAWWLAMVCSGAFGVVFNLLAARSRGMGEPGRGSGEPARFERAPVLGGILGAFFIAGAANLDATARALRWLAGWLEDPGGWWWFRSTRVMVDRGPGAAAIELITEFPAFSFVLGDNHPHLLSLPFVLLTVMVALNLQLAALAAPAGVSPASAASVRGTSALRQVVHSLRAGLAASTSARPWTAAVMVALVAGAPLAINTWDLPLLWLVLAIPAWTLGARAVSRAAATAGGLAGVLAAWTALVFSTVALFFPYLLTAQSQARGWLPNLFQPSHPWQFLLVFGAFLPAVAALLLAPGERAAGGKTMVLKAVASAVAVGAAILLAGALWASGTARGQEWAQPYLQGQGMLALAAGRWLGRPLVLLGLALGAGLAWRRMASLRAGASHSPDSSAQADRFAVLLVSLALAAALLPELLFVHDVFSSRINSIFKFYYQAWVMAALASAYAIVRCWAWSGTRSWLARCSLVLLVASAVYLPAAIAAKRAQAPGPDSLDGLAHLGADERAAFDWIRRWTRSEDIVLQAVGESYRAEHDRASAATGRATLLGWQGHEMQWRGASFGALSAGRREAAETIYRTGGAGDIERAVARFSIDYIYLGPVERELYAIDQDRERLLATLAQPVFSSGAFQILRYSRGSSAVP